MKLLGVYSLNENTFDQEQAPRPEMMFAAQAQARGMGAAPQVDLGMDIRSLPTPVSIMEVVGRNAGWTAAAAMLARERPDDAPHMIYVPEVPLRREQFLRDVQEVYQRQGWVVAVVSEGLRDEHGQSLGVALGAWLGPLFYRHGIWANALACAALDLIAIGVLTRVKIANIG